LTGTFVFAVNYFLWSWRLKISTRRGNQSRSLSFNTKLLRNYSFQEHSAIGSLKVSHLLTTNLENLVANAKFSQLVAISDPDLSVIKNNFITHKLINFTV